MLVDLGGEGNLNLNFCGQLISNLMKQPIWTERKWLKFGDRVLIAGQLLPLPLQSVCSCDCAQLPCPDPTDERFCLSVERQCIWN